MERRRHEMSLMTLGSNSRTGMSLNMTKKKNDKEFVRIRLDNKIDQDRSDITKWAHNNGKASGDFASDLYRLIRHYLDENVDPGATQFLLIREAMNMGLQVSKPDHLLSIATAHSHLSRNRSHHQIPQTTKRSK